MRTLSQRQTAATVSKSSPRSTSQHIQDDSNEIDAEKLQHYEGELKRLREEYDSLSTDYEEVRALKFELEGNYQTILQALAEAT